MPLYLTFRESLTPTLPGSTTVKGSPLSHLDLDANFKALSDALAATQPALVAGTNIKTVGGVSLLGAGDLPNVGYTGSQGPQGTTGYVGSRGTDGTIGYNGSVGYTGSSGYTGSAGVGIITDDLTTNASRFLLFDDVTSGASTTIGVSSTKLYFNPSTGTLSATTHNSLSDRLKKNNISRIPNATQTIKFLRGVEFTWKDNGTKSAGVVAQELEDNLPHLVSTDENGVKSVNYSGLIGYLIEAVKELDARVRYLETK